MISDIESLENFFDENAIETYVDRNSFNSDFDYINLNVFSFLLNKNVKLLSKFIDDAKQIHGDKYDYSYVDYKSRVIEVTIKCNSCGNTFNIKPRSHIFDKIGCTMCYFTDDDRRLHREKKFIFKLIQMYGSDFTYDKIKYFGTRKEVIITCSKCQRDYKRQPETLVRNKFKCRPCSSPKNKKII
ncbi:hypothetical protein ma851 [Moumouvirus australiensis]|uniref:Uncharacterized protein n=1 Tax=Moumouvirus australiensis TaxID=2109587 RepID=A0A2P1EMZ2_9VIRU|nr:hypothetical protein QKC55_gp053 [Moumouvirus australiensis]AVL95238.1 hypothetical protein ma851 [Moumouvirus australiensis]